MNSKEKYINNYTIERQEKTVKNNYFMFIKYQIFYYEM